MQEISINSVEMFISKLKEDQENWERNKTVWFRGQSNDFPLLPKLFRERKYNENNLIFHFRDKSKVLGETPHASDISEWLFLMQHSRLPTRLLDWTEGLLIALYFALYDVKSSNSKPVVWMLRPYKMNKISLGLDSIPASIRKPQLISPRPDDYLKQLQ